MSRGCASSPSLSLPPPVHRPAGPRRRDGENLDRAERPWRQPRRDALLRPRVYRDCCVNLVTPDEARHGPLACAALERASGPAHGTRPATRCRPAARCGVRCPRGPAWHAQGSPGTGVTGPLDGLLATGLATRRTIGDVRRPLALLAALARSAVAGVRRGRGAIRAAAATADGSTQAAPTAPSEDATITVHLERDDQALVDATIVGADCARRGLASEPSEQGRTGYGPDIPVIDGAGTIAVDRGTDGLASRHLTLATDESTPAAIAGMRRLLGFDDAADVTRGQIGGDESVTIRGDGALALAWRRGRFVGVVPVQLDAPPGATTEADVARVRTMARRFGAHDAPIGRTLAATWAPHAPLGPASRPALSPGCHGRRGRGHCQAAPANAQADGRVHAADERWSFPASAGCDLPPRPAPRTTPTAAASTADARRPTSAAALRLAPAPLQHEGARGQHDDGHSGGHGQEPVVQLVGALVARDDPGDQEAGAAADRDDRPRQGLPPPPAPTGRRLDALLVHGRVIAEHTPWP